MKKTMLIMMIGLAFQATANDASSDRFTQYQYMMNEQVEREKSDASSDRFTQYQYMTNEQVERAKSDARTGAGLYLNNKTGVGGSQSEVYSQLGISSLSPTGGAGSGFKSTIEGEVSYPCEPGQFVSMSGLNARVASCETNWPVVSLCDAETHGFDCESYSVSAELSGTQTVNTGELDRISKLFGVYRLETDCENQICTTKFLATSEASAPLSASESYAMGEEVKQQHMGSDSAFGQYLALMQSDEQKAMRQSVEAENHAECYQTQLGQLELDGKVSMSCDPQDTRTMSFTVDGREGANQGKMMCESTESGFCDQPIPINQYQIHTGQQVCTKEHTATERTCSRWTSLNQRQNFVQAHPNWSFTRQALTVSDCGDRMVNGAPHKCSLYSYRNYTQHGNNNISGSLTPGRIDNIINFNFGVDQLATVRIRATRLDDYLRVLVGSGAGDVTDGNRFVLNTDNRWGTGSDNGVSAVPWTNITNNLKNHDAIKDLNRFSINAAVWAVGSGEYDMDVEVIYRKYTITESQYDNCPNLVASSPNGTSVAGCYEYRHGACTDSSTRDIEGEKFDKSCWNFERYFMCVGNETSGCEAGTLMQNGWIKEGEHGHQYPTSVTGQNTSHPIRWDETWSYSGTDGINQYGCAASTSSSSRTDATGGVINTESRWCYQEPGRECKPSPAETEEEIVVCVVDSTSCNSEQHGLCVSQRQNWTCEKKYVCNNAFGNSLEDESSPANHMAALGTVIAAGEKAAAIAESLASSMSVGEDGEITIFDGSEERCHKMSSKTIDYANLTVLGLGASFFTGDIGPAAIVILNWMEVDRNRRNCCVDNPDNVPMETNFGFCDQGDIRLAAARMTNRAHQVVVGGNEYSIDDIEVENDQVEIVTVCTVDEEINPDTGEITEIETCNRFLVDGTCLDPASCGSEVSTDPSGRDYVTGECDQNADGTEQSCRVYVDQLGSNSQTVGSEADPMTSGDTGVGWIRGNRRGCYFITPGTKGQSPLTINHPGSTSRGSWWSSSQPFEMPFNCRYSILDVVETFQIDHYQSWCQFDSVLAKIFHQQGRAQLATLATSPATGGATREYNFSFYGYPAQGWTQQNTVNGNDVRFWQWDPACSVSGSESQQESAQRFIGQQAATTQGCPLTPDVYVAVCEGTGGCGSLPYHPSMETNAWSVFKLQAEELEIQALTPHVVVEGGCNASGICRYMAHAWRKGVGGTVNIPIDMSWALNSANHGWGVNYTSHNSMHFMAYTAPIGQQNNPKIMKCIGSPATCKQDGQGPWVVVDLDNPTALSGQTVHGSPRVTATGQCSENTNSCAYRLNIQVTLTAKPWHRGITHESRQYDVRPKIFGKYLARDRVRWNYDIKTDCSGFTLDEFLAIDMNAIDLSEFEAEMVARAESRMNHMMTEGFVSDVTSSVPLLISGSGLPGDEVGRKSFQISPSNGYPGTEVKFRPVLSEGNKYRVVRNGVEHFYAVSSYEIDWGDGRKTSRNLQNPEPLTHTYGNAENPPASNRTIIGTITWSTEAGQFSEKFTFEMWISSQGVSRGGEAIADPTTNQTPINLFNNMDENIRSISPF